MDFEGPVRHSRSDRDDFDPDFHPRPRAADYEPDEPEPDLYADNIVSTPFHDGIWPPMPHPQTRAERKQERRMERRWRKAAALHPDSPAAKAVWLIDFPF